MKTTEKAYHIALGMRLRRARVNCGLSQTNIGDLLGVTFQQVQKYEKGFNRISPFRLIQWSKETNVALKGLLDEESTPSPVVDMRARKIDLTFVRHFQKLPEELQRQFLGVFKVINGDGDE